MSDNTDSESNDIESLEDDDDEPDDHKELKDAKNNDKNIKEYHVDKKIENYIATIENNKASFDDKLNAYEKAITRLEELKIEYNEVVNELNKQKKKAADVDNNNDTTEINFDTLINELDETIQQITKKSDMKIALKQYFSNVQKIDKVIKYLSEKENTIKKVEKKNKKIELSDISDLLEDT